MMETRLYRDRFDAGKRLAGLLGAYAHRQDVLVLALPRGGVPVAFEVAKALNAPLDVFLVRKLGVPGREELAMGALASAGICVLNEDVISTLRISDQVINRVREQEQRELIAAVAAARSAVARRVWLACVRAAAGVSVAISCASPAVGTDTRAVISSTTIGRPIRGE